MITLIIIAWFLCGIIGAGFDYAYFKGRYPEQHDTREALGESLVLVIIGPIYMVIAFLSSGFAKYGWWGLWNK